MHGKFLLVAIVVASFTGSRSAQSHVLSQIIAQLKEEYAGKLSNLHAVFDKRQTQLEERYDELEKKYNSLKDFRQDNSRHVRDVTSEVPQSFYAQLSHDLSNIGDFQPIIFDVVTTNNGNGYNNADGIYTAPVSGTYVFSWTSANHVHTHMQTELVVNNKVFGRTWSDAFDHYDVAVGSSTVVVNLTAGDTVWIRSNTVHSRTIMGGMMSTFCGWLLY